MDFFKKTLEIEEGLIVYIERLFDFGKNDLKKYKFLPIQNSAYFYLDKIKEPLILPKLYAALEYLTGKGDNRYDDYKGSYSFTFKIKVQKNQMISEYIYHIYHYRSYIEFSVFQLVSKTDLRKETYMHQPDDGLFSDMDICNFSIYFCNYALGYMEGAQYIPQPFTKYSDSNLLSFGYSGSEYFLNDYEDEEEYTASKEYVFASKY